jgi:hypothetical protein
MPDLDRLSQAELTVMVECGRAALACAAALASAGGILGAALGHDAAPEAWRHYPAADVYDPATHAQYFYHTHAVTERDGEHGHFHSFLRARGMPTGVRPLVLPELAIADNPAAPASAPSAPQTAEGDDGDPWCHLVAVSMSAAGRPIKLFTTNRWVTGETWYRAADMVEMLDCFALGAVGPAPLLDRWITALVGLYRPQIAALIEARDAAIMDWRRRRRGTVHVFDDRRLEITSALDIEPEAQLRAVEAALHAIA